MKRDGICKELAAIGCVPPGSVRDDINYDKLKKQVRSLMRMCKEVIEEIEKDSPDDILISDVAVEEMLELVDEISSTVLRQNTL
jgi:hypothetical protein